MPTEMPNLRVDLMLELAEILRASGDATEATRAIGEAFGLYERKGNLVGALERGCVRACQVKARCLTLLTVEVAEAELETVDRRSPDLRGRPN